VPETVRREEALRAEFVDDLLRGDANVARMVHRAEPFGIDLGKPHHSRSSPPATLGGRSRPWHRIGTSRGGLGRWRDVLIAAKDSRVVIQASPCPRAMQAAVPSARLLEWPTRPLPADP
jgi:sugar diacid utilization regulator